MANDLQGREDRYDDQLALWALMKNKLIKLNVCDEGDLVPGAFASAVLYTQEGVPQSYRT